jgi:hypothetical protein
MCKVLQIGRLWSVSPTAGNEPRGQELVRKNFRRRAQLRIQATCSNLQESRNRGLRLIGVNAFFVVRINRRGHVVVCVPIGHRSVGVCGVRI